VGETLARNIEAALKPRAFCHAPSVLGEADELMKLAGVSG
jgi:hypothetical protein